MNFRSRSTVAACFLFLGTLVHAAGSNSTYSSFTEGRTVNGGPVALASSTIYISHPGYTFAESDGFFGPQTPCRAWAFIDIDGVRVSNGSLIDWTYTQTPAIHSFNVIGSEYLNPGWHTVTVYGQTLNGAAGFFGNLSVITDAAANVANNTLPADTPELSFNNYAVVEGNPLRSHSTTLRAYFNGDGTPVIVLTSGRSFIGTNDGDATWGIYFDGVEPFNSQFTWSNNEIIGDGELQAPMYSQGLFQPLNGIHDVSLESTAIPYKAPGNNGVSYRIGAGTRLITLQGGMTVVGNALTSYTVNGEGRYPYGLERWSNICIDTNGSNPGCPPNGSEVVLASANITIPAGHNGVVMFATKTRLQGSPTDPGGTGYLYLKIDGSVVGSLGKQQLKAPDAVGQRTMAASYLAAGPNALTPGTHMVQVIAKGVGNFKNLVVFADLPLIWFD